VCKWFLYYTRLQYWIWGPAGLKSSLYRGYFDGIKRLERDFGHSPPSRAVVKNDWSYNSNFPTRFHVLQS